MILALQLSSGIITLKPIWIPWFHAWANEESVYCSNIALSIVTGENFNPLYLVTFIWSFTLSNTLNSSLFLSMFTGAISWMESKVSGWLLTTMYWQAGVFLEKYFCVVGNSNLSSLFVWISCTMLPFSLATCIPLKRICLSLNRTLYFALNLLTSPFYMVNQSSSANIIE